MRLEMRQSTCSGLRCLLREQRKKHCNGRGIKGCGWWRWGEGEGDVVSFTTWEDHSGRLATRHLEGNKNESERTVRPANIVTQARDNQEGDNADGGN